MGAFPNVHALRFGQFALVDQGMTLMAKRRHKVIVCFD
jgi:hypothetical protein